MSFITENLLKTFDFCNLMFCHVIKTGNSEIGQRDFTSVKSFLKVSESLFFLISPRFCVILYQKVDSINLGWLMHELILKRQEKM